MHFINYFSAKLNYYDQDLHQKTEFISGPNLTVQDLQKMLKSKQQFLAPGFAYLYLFHNICFFDEPGEKNPKQMNFSPIYVLFGDNDHKYTSLKASIHQDKQYADYIIKTLRYGTKDTSIFYYISNIDTTKKIITLAELPNSTFTIVNPITLEQTVAALSAHKGQVAPMLNNFFKPTPEINPIPEEKQVTFVENCTLFKDWVKTQITGKHK